MVRMQEVILKNSDIDIMILTDFDKKELIKYRKIIRELASDIENENDFEVMISPVLRNIDDFNSWLDIKTFYMNIINEGVVLVGEKV